jgi:hypothetical protein
LSLVHRVARKAGGRLFRMLGDRGETLLMYDALGYFPNLVFPRSFSEKVVRRKLESCRPIWSLYADKVGVRRHVDHLVGSEYLTEVFHVTDNPETIDLRSLPSQFVVKASHGSGWTCVVRDSGAVDEQAIRDQCLVWLGKRYGVETHEDWYAPIQPRIVIEEYLADRRYDVPLDFKFWVFHGHVEFVQVDFGRFALHTRTIYNRHWKRQPWVTLYPQGPDTPRPPKLAEMIELAEALAPAEEFVRVDLYSPNDTRVVFGELTLAPGAGWEPFVPSKKWDFEVGSLW